MRGAVGSSLRKDTHNATAPVTDWSGRPPGDPDFRNRRVQLDREQSLVLVRCGVMGTPVILIHGMYSTGETLRPIQERLEAAGYHCWAPTLPHHSNGGDAAKVGPTSLRTYVDFLERFIADQRFDSPPLLVGHSMGGLLAQLLAARIPTAGAALFAPTPPPGGIPSLSWSGIRFFFPVTTRPFWWKRAHKPAKFTSACSALFNNLAPTRQRELFDALVAESGRALFEIALAPLDRTKAAAVDCAAIRVPIVILHGTKDGVLPSAGSRKLQKRYPDAVLHDYPGSGHWLFEEPHAVDAIYDDLTAWLAARAIRP
jgi:pimeloyl-ACP methyl ester carboxylesterase